MSPDQEATWLAWNHNYDRVTTPVVSVVSTVVAGVGRRDRGYREQSGKQQDQDLSHFCSCNFSLMQFSRDFNFGFPTQ